MDTTQFLPDEDDLYKFIASLNGTGAFFYLEEVRSFIKRTLEKVEKASTIDEERALLAKIVRAAEVYEKTNNWAKWLAFKSHWFALGELLSSLPSTCEFEEVKRYKGEIL